MLAAIGWIGLETYHAARTSYGSMIIQVLLYGDWRSEFGRRTVETVFVLGFAAFIVFYFVCLPFWREVRKRK